ncbi:MAG: hypothetical protein IIC74_06560 [Bacteroidetes bacterium]|nr:hypothetical protein [Bacteroidota bacterium]
MVGEKSYRFAQPDKEDTRNLMRLLGCTEFNLDGKKVTAFFKSNVGLIGVSPYLPPE